MLPEFNFAFRRLAKAPGFSAVALLTLALGIGLNTSMFSLMNLLVLKPLPFPAADELVRIYRTTPQANDASHAAPDTDELARASADFARVAVYRQWGYTLMPDGRPPVNLNALRVSASFFPTLGLRPAAGRWFTPEEDQAGNHVVMLSYDLWQSQFGGDPSIVGRNVRIDGEATTVVGVVPADFASVFLWGPADAFRPLALTAAEREDRNAMEYVVVARLAGGLAPEQAGERLATLARRLAEGRAKERSQDGLRAVSLAAIAHNPGTKAISGLMVGLGAAVLAIACANLANLQLARAVARSHEFAIRAALGATRGRLVRPMVAESLLLSLAGGLLGILVALWANDWISSRLSANGIFRLTLELDWRVLSFAFAVSVVTGLAFGLVPAWLMARVRVNESLKSGGRGNTGDRTQHRLQHGLIISQFANAVVLLAAAGGFIRNLDQFIANNPGWQQGGIVQAVLNLPPAQYDSTAKTYQFYTTLQERLAALPGAQSASVSWTLPVFTFLQSRSLVVEGQPAPPAGHEPLAYINGITPTYLATLGMAVQSGRNFTAADRPGAVRVALINAAMAAALFPHQDPIGHRIGSPDAQNPGWLEIVGVVPDVGMAVGGVPQRTRFQVYCPLAQETWNYVTVAVRADHPERLAPAMRETIAALDPNLAIQQFGTIREVTRLVTGGMSMLSTLLVCFAVLGLFLAALGLSGVIAHLVAQRTMEIGVRVALGAQARDVLWMVLRSGLRLTLIGTVLGLAGALALGYGMAALVHQPAKIDPLLFAGVAFLLVLVGLLACWLPARRAAGVDPIVALRAQ